MTGAQTNQSDKIFFSFLTDYILKRAKENIKMIRYIKEMEKKLNNLKSKQKSLNSLVLNILILNSLILDILILNNLNIDFRTKNKIVNLMHSDIANYVWCRKERLIDSILLQHVKEILKIIKDSHIYEVYEMENELLNNLNIYFRAKYKLGNLIYKYKQITSNKIMAKKKISTKKQMYYQQQKNDDQQNTDVECFMDRIFLQNAEKNITTMKNRHLKEKAEALFNKLKNKDFRTKNKIGNLYVIKNDNDLISTSGAIKTYIGFSKDGTLVAVQCGFINPKNTFYFTNEFNNLQNNKLESKNIIKYVSLEEDKNIIYIAVKLWDYYLDEYIENLHQSEIDQQQKIDKLKKIVKEMFLGLQVLHQAGVIHGDINPRNIVIGMKCIFFILI